MTPRKKIVLRRCKYCDKEFYVRAYEISRGNGTFCSKPCASTTHKQSNSRLYMTWAMMIQRCTNPKNTKFPMYGGAGITVSKEWRESFETFFSDLGERPVGKSLDRINGKLGYFKENCRWATPREQNQNLKSNRLLTFRGETKCVSEWARTVGLSKPTVIRRLDYGWTVEEALTIPGNNQFQIATIRKKRLAEILS